MRPTEGHVEGPDPVLLANFLGPKPPFPPSAQDPGEPLVWGPAQSLRGVDIASVAAGSITHGLAVGYRP